MPATPEEILTDEKLNELGSAFADCVKETFKEISLKAKITVYMRTPKYDDKGNMSGAFRYTISDDSVDEETLKEIMELQREPLRQCFFNKLSSNKNREPGRNWVGYLGHVLYLDDAQDTESDEQLIGLHSLDKSQWIEIIELAQKKNWYSNWRSGDRVDHRNTCTGNMGTPKITSQ